MTSTVPFSVPREDIITPTTVLSTLQGPHSVGEGILGFLTTREGNTLRQVNSEMHEAVSEAVWKDKKTRIAGDIAAWRKSFPHARTANMSNRSDLVDADFVHFKGIKTLDISMSTSIGLYGEPVGVTDKAFEHLEGIRSLDMTRRFGITGTGFVHLKGLKTLIMPWCRSIPNEAFVNLKDIESLDIRYCSSITDECLAPLKKLKMLRVNGCTGISDAALLNLKGVHIRGRKSIEANTSV